MASEYLATVPVEPTFALLSQWRNILAHDEAEKVYDLVKELRAVDDSDRWTRDDGSPFSQAEVWRAAIDEALLVIDERMTWLREA